MHQHAINAPASCKLIIAQDLPQAAFFTLQLASQAQRASHTSQIHRLAGHLGVIQGHGIPEHETFTGAAHIHRFTGSFAGQPYVYIYTCETLLNRTVLEGAFGFIVRRSVTAQYIFKLPVGESRRRLCLVQFRKAANAAAQGVEMYFAFFVLESRLSKNVLKLSAFGQQAL
jgi:hypothetical protein